MVCSESVLRSRDYLVLLLQHYCSFVKRKQTPFVSTMESMRRQVFEVILGSFRFGVLQTAGVVLSFHFFCFGVCFPEMVGLCNHLDFSLLWSLQYNSCRRVEVSLLRSSQSVGVIWPFGVRFRCLSASGSCNSWATCHFEFSEITQK